MVPRAHLPQISGLKTLPSSSLPTYPLMTQALKSLTDTARGIYVPFEKWMAPNTGFCSVWSLPKFTYYFQRLLAGPVWKARPRLFCLLGTTSAQKNKKTIAKPLDERPPLAVIFPCRAAMSMLIFLGYQRNTAILVPSQNEKLPLSEEKKNIPTNFRITSFPHHQGI